MSKLDLWEWVGFGGVCYVFVGFPLNKLIPVNWKGLLDKVLSLSELSLFHSILHTVRRILRVIMFK